MNPQKLLIRQIIANALSAERVNAPCFLDILMQVGNYVIFTELLTSIYRKTIKYG